MLCDAIRLGSEIFHANEPRRSFYDQYLAEKDWTTATNPEHLELVQMERLILFLRQWSTQYYRTTSAQLLESIRQLMPVLRSLDPVDLLTADFGGPCTAKLTVGQALEAAFGLVVTAGTREESTGTSKILHVTCPRLFVMWDSAIRSGYAVAGGWESYARRFAPLMQKLAKRAVADYMARRDCAAHDAVAFLCPCGHTLTKVLDEYNYAKFTLKRDDVGDAELALAAP